MDTNKIEYLTVAEFARLKKISTTAVYELVHRGRLKTTKSEDKVGVLIESDQKIPSEEKIVIQDGWYRKIEASVKLEVNPAIINSLVMFDLIDNVTMRQKGLKPFLVVNLDSIKYATDLDLLKKDYAIQFGVSLKYVELMIYRGDLKTRRLVTPDKKIRVHVTLTDSKWFEDE